VLIPALLASDNSVLVTIGAGDIGEMVSEIKNAFEEKISPTKISLS
jgi:hypothetical protein